MSATALSTELSSFRTAVAEAYQQRDDAKNEAKIKETLAPIYEVIHAYVYFFLP